MTAIISENFRILNAKNFLESLAEGSSLTEATSDERTKTYFFVGRPQRWSSYLEIYNASGSFQVGERIFVSGAGYSVSSTPFGALVEAVFENVLVVTNIIPAASATPSMGATISGNISNTTAKAGIYRYGTDETPVRPFDNQTEAFEIHNDMISMKRIASDQVRAVARRYNWNPSLNPKFDMWRPDYSASNIAQVDPDGSGVGLPSQNLTNAKFYVINNNYEVWKCLFNGTSESTPTGIVASLEPTTTPAPSGSGVYDSATGIFTEFPTVANGYVWKYLYTIPTSDVIRFLSTDFIPVANNTIVQTLASAQAGSITTIIISSVGANLPTSQLLFSKILGDGTGGIVAIQTNSSGNISSAYLCNSSGQRVNISGSGYSYANIILKNGYLFSNATLATPVVVAANATGFISVVVPPRNGHGSDPISELSAKRIMANVRLTYSEGQGDFPVDNDFRRIGIITNPKLPAPSLEFATQESLSGLYALKLNNVSVGFVTDEYIKQEISTGKFAIGSVVSWIFDEVPIGQTASSGILKYFQEPNTHKNNGVVNKFVSDASKLITGQTSLITGNIETTYSTGGAILPLSGLSFINGLALPEIAKYSGDIVYIENRRLITRAPDQIEDIKLVIEF